MDIWMLIGVLTVAAAAFQRVPPTPPQPPSTPHAAPGSGSRVSNYVRNNDGRELTVRTVGNVTFDPDREPMLMLSRDARLEVIEHRSGVKRHLVQTADKVTWSIEDVERPFDIDARAWLEQALRSAPKTPTLPTPPSGR